MCGRILDSSALLSQKAYRRTVLLISGAFFIFFVFLCASMPYCGDDWPWGLDEKGLDWLLNASVNSRYAGNLMAVILTRSDAAKTLVMAATYTLMPLLAVEVFLPRCIQPDKSLLTFSVLSSYMLFFIVPKYIWCETVGWPAGFANYVFSLFVFLIFVIQNMNLIEKDDDSKYRVGKTITAGFAAFILQMYIENLTVVVLFMAVVLFVSSLLIYRRIVPQYTAVLVGAVAGCMLMFSSDIYSTLVSEGKIEELQRGVSYDISGSLSQTVFTMLYNFAGSIITRLYERNYYLCPLIVLLSSVLIIKRRRSLSRSALLLVPLNAFCFFFPFSNLLGIGSKLYGIYWNYNIKYTLAGSAAFFLIMAVNLFLIFRENRKMLFAALFFWTAPPLILAPMAAVNYMGWRSLYTAYFLLLIIILMLLYQLYASISSKAAGLLSAMIIVLLAANLIRYAVVYSTIGKAMRERAEIISAARIEQSESIYLPAFPYQDYMISAEPKSKGWENYFRVFYGIPMDVELIFGSVD